MKLDLQYFTGRAAGDLIERKYLAHFIDANFGTGTASYQRLGEDLEEYNIDLNPDVETKKNIWGESKTRVKGYEPQSGVDIFYCKEDDAMYTKLLAIVNGRSTGASLETTVVDVIIDTDGTAVEAYRENVIVVPQSIGGDTAGMQIPFNIYYNGSRVSGTWAPATKAFTAAD